MKTLHAIIWNMLFIFILSVALVHKTYENAHITETERTEAFNEGVSHGVCITVKAAESAQAVDECFKMEKLK